jgi:hypothetical protein
MNRFVVLSSTVLAIVGFRSAVALSRFDSQDRMRPRLSAEDPGALTDARVASLKAGLGLTPNQAKNWPAFERVYRNIAQLRRDRFIARGAKYTRLSIGASPIDCSDVRMPLLSTELR